MQVAWPVTARTMLRAYEAAAAGAGALDDDVLTAATVAPDEVQGDVPMAAPIATTEAFPAPSAPPLPAKKKMNPRQRARARAIRKEQERKEQAVK